MARTALSDCAKLISNNNNRSSNTFAVDVAKAARQQCTARGPQRMAPMTTICLKKQKLLKKCITHFCSADVQQKCRDDDDDDQNSDVHHHPQHLRHFNFRHSFSHKMTFSLSLFVIFSVGCTMPGGIAATAAPRSRRTLVPLGMDKQMFPAQSFDENAPICTAEREPCGFYSFSLDGKAPLKWIKSWCRCSAQHECVYERTDMRMRVYRQTCIAQGDLLLGDDDDGEETVAANDAAQRRQQSVVLVETVPTATTSADRDHDDTVVVVVEQDDDHHPQRTHRHHHHHYRHSNRHLHRHNSDTNVVTTLPNASRHSRKAHRQRQVIRRLRELVMND